MADSPQPLDYHGGADGPDCPRCGQSMVRGVSLIDRGSGAAPGGILVWIRGRIRRGWFGVLRLPRGPRLDVIAFRCPGCGLIEHYAPPK